MKKEIDPKEIPSRDVQNDVTHLVPVSSRPDGVAFEDLPDDWKCPRCKQGKEKFNKA